MDPEKPLKTPTQDFGSSVFAILVLILALMLGHAVFLQR
jgi:hypothetical protein